MAEKEIKSDSGDGFIVGLVLVALIALVMFGDWFGAGENVLARTKTAQRRLSETINKYFMEDGRMEIKMDDSVVIYISKSGYEHIPYPDRETVMKEIGDVWFKDDRVQLLLLPKVQLRDIKTGDTLATYRCYRMFY